MRRRMAAARGMVGREHLADTPAGSSTWDPFRSCDRKKPVSRFGHDAGRVAVVCLLTRLELTVSVPCNITYGVTPSDRSGIRNVTIHVTDLLSLRGFRLEGLAG